jgi:hypothetical protein
VRLSDVLNRAPDTSRSQVEGFLGTRRVRWGQHKTIEVGKVFRNYFCRKCHADRTFASGDGLSCLITGERTVSIDVTLRCIACESPMEAWFLVRTDDDLLAPSPFVHLERFTENRRDNAGRPGAKAGQIDDLFERAQIAFEDGLGAGALIYLRKIFEMVTTQAAGAVEISAKSSNGRSKPFKALLEEVDRTSHIVPEEFSKNGYRLFSELSDVIHGDADEAVALVKYDPCRELVLGIVNNVKTKQAMRAAASILGWSGSPAEP